MHMAVVAISAPFIAIGIAGRSVDPVRRWPGLFSPVPLSIVELIVVWAWHAPALHHAARHTPAGFAAEQGMFLIVALAVWLSAFGGNAKARERAGAGTVALLLTSMHMTLLGALLALAPRPLYAHHEGFGALTPLADQQLGGAIMILAGGASYLIGGLWLSNGLCRQKPYQREACA
jgi:putative membrane protein